MRLNKFSWRVLFGFVAMVCFNASAQSINFNIGLNGLTSLTYGSSQLVASASNGMFRPTSVSFKKADGTPVSTTIGSSYTVDLVNKIVTHTTANKFAIQCHYVKVSDTRLDFKFVVKNLSADIFTGVKAQFVTLSADSLPQYIHADCNGLSCRDGNPFGGWYNGTYGGGLQDIPSWETGGPPNMVFFQLGHYCNVAVCQPSNPTLDYSWSVQQSGNSLVGFKFSLYQNVSPNGYSDTSTISFRFDPAGKLTPQRFNLLCADAIMSYGGAYPSIVNWPDRRPIGREMISEPINTTGRSTPQNPNRWFGNDTTDFDIRTTAGKETFRTMMLGRADACVRVLRKMNAQGFINWSIEGFGYLNGTTGYVDSDYPGDPSMATTLAPELNYMGPNSKDSIVDEYFKKFRDAGLLPGLCIDPQKIMPDGNLWKVVDAVDPGAEILRKVGYAHDRWGCRLFYVDANLWGLYDSII